MNYSCEPKQKIGHRINAMRLANGELIEASKAYTVAGWATVNNQASGAPVWEQVANHIRHHKRITIDSLNTPKLIGVDNNLGLIQDS